ncbi:MAG: 16S rRNA (guanine(966)-N(2))-methyltransferase RsmD [Lachnospirales bacterium]
MRVISGQARGTKLFEPANNNIRPTTDRIKETLFNIINFYIEGANVLDLYSGSGALGIECLSRGATHCTFVEKEKEHCKLIEKNLEKTKFFSDRFIVLNKSIGQKVGFPTIENNTYDIILMDPPYNMSLENETIEFIYKKNILKERGIIVIEHSSSTKLNLPEGFTSLKEKNFKTTTITILQKNENSNISR